MASYGLEDRLVRFGATTCQLGNRLPRTPLGQHVALQLARSSTSTFANYGEVQSAESRRDFIHKLAICLKELRESRRWGRLIAKKNWLGKNDQLAFILAEGEELIRIFNASIQTAERNRLVRRKRANPGATGSA